MQLTSSHWTWNGNREGQPYLSSTYTKEHSAKGCRFPSFVKNSVPEQKYTSLPCIFGMVTAACTYEGENTVLMLQIARWVFSGFSTLMDFFLFQVLGESKFSVSGTWWKHFSVPGTWWKHMDRQQTVNNFTPPFPISPITSTTTSTTTLTTTSTTTSTNTSPPTISTKQERRMPSLAKLLLLLTLMAAQATTIWSQTKTLQHSLNRWSKVCLLHIVKWKFICWWNLEI